MATGFTHQNIPDLDGKTALVTGANAGLGFEISKALAKHGAHVIVACRSQDKCDQTIAAICTEYPEGKLSPVQLNLGDLSSIRAAAKELLVLPQLNLLINNAGIMVPPRELTKDGFESQFGVNHLGPFALSGLLLEKLMETPAARIINTSSLASLSGKINFEDINAEEHYSAMQRYCMSKLANLLFSVELDRRLKAAGSDTMSIACHPGVATTELSRHLPSWFKLFEPMITLMFNTPEQGAWAALQAATQESVSGGEYYGPSGFRQYSGPTKRISVPRVGRDQTIAKELWDISEQLTGVTYALAN